MGEGAASDAGADDEDVVGGLSLDHGPSRRMCVGQFDEVVGNKGVRKGGWRGDSRKVVRLPAENGNLYRTIDTTHELPFRAAARADRDPQIESD